LKNCAIAPDGRYRVLLLVIWKGARMMSKHYAITAVSLPAGALFPGAERRERTRSLGHPCGQKLAAPLLIAPTGYNGMLRYGADAMLARVARDAGIGYIQSTVSTAPIEEIAAENLPQHWFQLYVLKDRTVTTGLLERAKAAGCTTLVVSVDAVHFGNREKDKRNYRRPMKLSSPVCLISRYIPPGYGAPSGLRGYRDLVT
jgi:hypothetical protein